MKVKMSQDVFAHRYQDDIASEPLHRTPSYAILYNQILLERAIQTVDMQLDAIKLSENPRQSLWFSCRESASILHFLEPIIKIEEGDVLLLIVTRRIFEVRNCS